MTVSKQIASFATKIKHYLWTYKNNLSTIEICAIVACGVSLSNAAQHIGSYHGVQGAGNRDYCP